MITSLISFNELVNSIYLFGDFISITIIVKGFRRALNFIINLNSFIDLKGDSHLRASSLNTVKNLVGYLKLLNFRGSLILHLGI